MIYSQHRQNFRACGGQKTHAGQLDYPPSIEHPRHLPRGREYPGIRIFFVRRTIIIPSCGITGIGRPRGRRVPAPIDRHRCPVCPGCRSIPNDYRIFKFLTLDRNSLLFGRLTLSIAARSLLRTLKSPRRSELFPARTEMNLARSCGDRCGMWSLMSLMLEG